MTKLQIFEASTSEEITACFPVLAELRPNLTLELAIIKIQKQQNEGYHLMYIKNDNHVLSILGYRIVHHLAWGEILYIDDLATNSKETNNGYASTLLDWAFKKAKSLGCEQLHLDTGYDRKEAQILYLKYNFNFSCHHMASIL